MRALIIFSLFFPFFLFSPHRSFAVLGRTERGWLFCFLGEGGWDRLLRAVGDVGPYSLSGRSCKHLPHGVTSSTGYAGPPSPEGKAFVGRLLRRIWNPPLQDQMRFERIRLQREGRPLPYKDCLFYLLDGDGWGRLLRDVGPYSLSGRSCKHLPQSVTSSTGYAGPPSPEGKA